MRALAVLVAVLALPLTGSLVPLLPAPAPAEGGGPYNGLDAWHPGMGYAAPIARGFAFVEGKGVLWHSLDPVLMPTDDALGRLYQFPNCPALRPVLGDDTLETDSAMRQIIDAVLASCDRQPVGEADLFGIGVLHQSKRQLFVNAPIIPEPYASWPDTQLFNGPPYRPRVSAFFEGSEVSFITYDVNWLPPWAGTAFPGHNVDLFVLSGDQVFVPGETRLSLFNGAPLDVRVPSDPAIPFVGTHRGYSPVWEAFCIAPEETPVCGAYRGADLAQCTRIVECTNQEGMVNFPAPFQFVNCPIVNTDVDGDGYLSEAEEFAFPTLWEDSGWIALT